MLWRVELYPWVDGFALEQEAVAVDVRHTERRQRIGWHVGQERVRRGRDEPRLESALLIAGELQRVPEPRAQRRHPEVLLKHRAALGCAPAVNVARVALDVEMTITFILREEDLASALPDLARADSGRAALVGDAGADCVCGQRLGDHLPSPSPFAANGAGAGAGLLVFHAG
jgi:hypothetical protein